MKNAKPYLLPSKIQPRHQERLAIVYVRQSSPGQVLKHPESAAMQYELVTRAQALGWSVDRIEVVDDDQGHSATTTEGRDGFKRIAAEVALDHVGIIIGTEVSRCRVNTHSQDSLVPGWLTILASSRAPGARSIVS